jgi:hypothetical protein
MEESVFISSVCKMFQAVCCFIVWPSKENESGICKYASKIEKDADLKGFFLLEKITIILLASWSWQP